MQVVQRMFVFQSHAIKEVWRAPAGDLKAGG